MGAQSKDVADYSQLLEGAIWSLTILSTIFVALRVYAKIFWKRALLWDDWFLIASWVRSHHPSNPISGPHHSMPARPSS